MSEQKVGERLLTILEEKKISRAELARLSGRSKSAISDIVSGRRNMSADFAVDLAKALKVPPEFLFREMGFLPPKNEKDELTEAILHELGKLPPKEREDILGYIRLRQELAERRKSEH